MLFQKATGPRALRYFSVLVVGVFLVTGFACKTFAQTASGTINGTITDAKGAAMSGVAVTVHNDDTGLDTAEKTNDAGFYTAPLLQPGTYDVTAMQTGFSTVVSKNVQDAGGPDAGHRLSDAGGLTAVAGNGDHRSAAD